MKIKTPSAILVDVHGKDSLETFIPLIKKITADNENDVGGHHYIYFLSDEDTRVPIPTNLSNNGHVTTTNTIGPGRLQCFYEAKRKFDNDEVVEVRILCCKPCEEYWKTVCEILLTPVHTWRVEATPCEVTIISDVGTVEDDVKDMLTRLPGLGELTVLKSPLIPSHIFNHGYTTRKGGVTTIPSLASLNLLYTPKKRDSRLTVAENVRRLAESAKFDPKMFHVTRTDHGNRVWVVGKEQPERFDAIVTNQPGLTIAAAGADCTPVLFVDPVKRVCGAAHAGYRGTLKKVVIKTIEALVQEYGSRIEDILVTLGPTVGPECFSFQATDPAVKEFQAIDPSVVEVKGEGDDMRATPNLVLSNKLLLERAGVDPAHIDTSLATCTACDPERFFSYERDRFPFGNHIGFVCIKT